MNPSDTHIERMAETFAERTPFLRRTRREAVETWRDALELAREDGTLGQIEHNMKERTRGCADLPVQDVWERARAYPGDKR
ncbi:MAG: hypothetical protein H6738_05325 [Alphaproteobacteria bacterium]|nr:hypothetical protein [Alphaproteobacteria bacterium]MCB9696188.1 hypothetical protein [Alphaproteobacteria bacterium]